METAPTLVSPAVAAVVWWLCRSAEGVQTISVPEGFMAAWLNFIALINNTRMTKHHK